MRTELDAKAVVCSISSDAHTWNLVYLQLLLEDLGFDVRNLGACTEVADLVEVCRTEPPALVVLSTVNGHGHIEGPAYAGAISSLPGRDGITVVIGGKLGVDGATEQYADALLAAGFDGVFGPGEAELARFRARVAALARTGPRQTRTPTATEVM
ncbi:cobalamin B12-binding domain-containing protein [Streptomyces sp. NPDC002587]